MAAAPDTRVDRAAVLLRAPGLVVVTGPPGCGRSTLLRRLGTGAPGPAHSGGGLAMLAGVPALALSRAVRARLPVHDVHLLAEAVRSRVRGGLLILDDLQYADPATLAALPLIAAHCRVLVALRTPHRIPADALEALRSMATGWIAVPPLTRDAALDLVKRTAQLDEPTVRAVVDRAGGNPLAITALARQAAAGRSPAAQDIDQVAYAIATALADLPRPARTALAALGLLGRPASGALLGPGAADLIAAGLVAPVTAADPAASSADPVGAASASSADPASADPASADPASADPASADPASADPASADPASADPASADAASGGRVGLTTGSFGALTAADLVGELAPVSTYVAETAAGLLDAPGRTELHLRLAELTPPAEAARHLAAAGDLPGAFKRALQAADQASGGDRAALLLFACDLELPVDPRVRLAAADAALAAGRPAAAARVLTTAEPLGAEADVLRGEALLQAGEPAAARASVQPIPDAAPAAVLAARDRVLLLAELATDPANAGGLAGKIAARHPHPTPGVAAALAAVQAHQRTPGWAEALAAAAAATTDPLISRWTSWLLVESLVGDGRLADAALAAQRAAGAAADDLAYGWQTRFVAAADWALALHGTGLGLPGGGSAAATGPGTAAVGGAAGDAAGGGPAGAGRGSGRTEAENLILWDGAEGVLRRAANLTDRALPDEARGYATAATALIEADTGLLAAARERLKAGPEHAATAWVAREAAWLDGQPDLAAKDPTGSDGLLAGLHAITARWAAHDLGVSSTPGIPGGVPGTVRRTLTAWATGMGFAAAAEGWRPVALREQIRCLLAAGLTDQDQARAVAALLQAEQLADAAGLTVLAGRARRGLRRHHVHRDTRSPRSGDQLTRRERDVLRLVAAGEPTRRIAGQLGISAETVDTHIRAGMRKLGARTRTEAAALAFAAHGAAHSAAHSAAHGAAHSDSPDATKDGR